MLNEMLHEGLFEMTLNDIKTVHAQSKDSAGCASCHTRQHVIGLFLVCQATWA
jgi:hypothetical protein